MRLLLRGCQYLLFTIAAVALCYCAFVLGSAWLYQKQQNQALDRLLRRQAAPTETTVAPPVSEPVSPPDSPRFTASGLIGRIEIPRLKLSVVLAEGADDSTLRKAAGHITGTAFPGDPGNVGIAGHRDTFFRPLRKIHANDLIVLDTIHGRYRYQVVSTEVVKPSDLKVLAPTPRQVLTMVTCYPFYFVGSAPYRFIVKARRLTG